MKPISAVCLSQAAKLVQLSAALPLTLLLTVPASARAQSPLSEAPADIKATDSKPDPGVYQTLHIANLTEPKDASELVTDLRNVLPRARIYYVAPEAAISIRATPEDLQIAQKILSEIDRPKKVYRLTYTINETDNGKSTGSQHFSLVVVSGERTELRQGSKVPIMTGVSPKQDSNLVSQTQYLDIGLSIQADIEGGKLRTKVEQSNVSDERSGIGAQDPIIRQTVLNGMMLLPAGKPVVLGSLDIPGTARRQEVEVAAELVP
jgi:type II secretory pathway component GspD/PulD (secretin)